MLTQIRASTQFLTSRSLTLAIVAAVVLINSVAWGIPLFVGDSSGSSQQLDSSQIVTGAVSKLGSKLEKPSMLSASAKKQSNHLLVPLPDKAPKRTFDNSIVSTKQIAGASRTVEPPVAALSRKPSTLFPQPEPRLKLPKPPHIASVLQGRVSDKRQANPLGRTLAHEVVLVSPYTPGVRISSNGRGHEWRHRNLRVANGETTHDTAKAIAHRAARRFEQMRDKMTKLDARSARRSKEGRIQRQALLPVAPRPPRIAGYSSDRSASKSARSFVRARLVRRPLAGAAPLDVHTRLASREPNAPNLNHRITQSSASHAFKSRQVARLTPTVRRSIKRSRRSAVRNRRSRAKRSYRRRGRVIRRAAMVRRSKRSRRTGKINGFRRGFHRQLVAANFFGTSH